MLERRRNKSRSGVATIANVVLNLCFKWRHVILLESIFASNFSLDALKEDD